MHTKIFLSSLLATFLAVGVTATPATVKARDIKTDHQWNGQITDLAKVATPVGDIKPPPKGNVITPKDNDVPVVSTSVDTRDLGNLEKRTAGCIFVTADGGFNGNSVYLCIAANGGCTNWNDYWRKNISSFGPDPGTTCKIYTNPNCGGSVSVAFGYPGYGNLGGWNDNMGSFRCWW